MLDIQTAMLAIAAPAMLMFLVAAILAIKSR